MVWSVEFSKEAFKQLGKLDRTAARRIVRHIEEVATAGNVRDTGKALKGNLGTYWRYRVGSYRAICQLQDRKLLILVIEVGHRKSVYE